MKAGATTFVAAAQPGGTMDVIRNRAKDIGSHVVVAPAALEHYGWGRYPPSHLGLVGDVQKINASLALQVSRRFMLGPDSDAGSDDGKPFDLEAEEALGLRLCSWPGRTQTVVLNDNTVLMLDGAHTQESILACISWYRKASEQSKDCFRVLLFNATMDRRSERMLRPLSLLGFDLAVFCTNISRLPGNAVSDNTNRTITLEGMSAKCEDNRRKWEDMCNTRCVVVPHLNDALALVLRGRHDVPVSGGQVLEDSLVDIPESGLRQVLITGSLHLVGGVLELVRPDVCHRTEVEVEREEQLAKEYSKLANGRENEGSTS
jgi:folylpolyglutamate synthase